MAFRRRRRRPDDDFAAEVESHLESETARLIGEGLTEHEARSRARRNFGNVTRARERFHERQHFVWPGQLAQDLRYAWRGLWHSRAFLATTVLTLAVGMSLVSVVFGVFNAYVLGRSPCTILTASTRWVGDLQEAGGSGFRMQDYQDLQGRQRPLRRSHRGDGAERRLRQPCPRHRIRVGQLFRDARRSHRARPRLLRRLTQPSRAAKPSRF